MAGSAPRNRRERRATAKDGQDADSIPMSQPDRTKPKGRTLFEIAAEREAALRGGSKEAFTGVAGDTGEPSVVTINPDGTLSGPDGEPLTPGMSAKVKASMDPDSGTLKGSGHREESLNPEGAALAEAILYIFTLLLLHFTFSVLVYHQYGLKEDLRYGKLAWQTVSLVPVLAAIVLFLHPRANSNWAQVLFFIMSTGAGSWLIYASSTMPYMAVMKRAPGAGTIWIWSALESRAEIALASAAAVGIFFWYGKYSIYE